MMLNKYNLIKYGTGCLSMLMLNGMAGCNEKNTMKELCNRPQSCDNGSSRAVSGSLKSQVSPSETIIRLEDTTNNVVWGLDPNSSITESNGKVIKYPEIAAYFKKHPEKFKNICGIPYEAKVLTQELDQAAERKKEKLLKDNPGKTVQEILKRQERVKVGYRDFYLEDGTIIKGLKLVGMDY